MTMCYPKRNHLPNSAYLFQNLGPILQMTIPLVATSSPEVIMRADCHTFGLEADVDINTSSEPGMVSTSTLFNISFRKLPNVFLRNPKLTYWDIHGIWKMLREIYCQGDKTSEINCLTSCRGDYIIE